MMGERQIKQRIESLKKEIEVLESILEFNSSDSLLGRPKNSLKYTNLQIDFLNKNKHLPQSELIKLFNEEFKTDIDDTSRALYNVMMRLGIITPNFTRDYVPRNPISIARSIETKEKKFLKKVGVNGN